MKNDCEDGTEMRDTIFKKPKNPFSKMVFKTETQLRLEGNSLKR